MKKLVDADSREASGKAKVQEGPPAAVDAVLEQIRKKPKLSVLDKTKKDWGEFKEERLGRGAGCLQEEWEPRADYRKIERERDARLALQAKRKPDTSMTTSIKSPGVTGPVSGPNPRKPPPTRPELAGRCMKKWYQLKFKE
ncbi:hypothetical protein RJ640_017850 [Escallonia rubra]|uniref:BCNT-C domain-containing protein n=1 Tax=Escallonia rubra TaxID=112253 RepID=A0AA88RQN1_9ASTE|nr:hypothetical protein RJ640_017850 [Escallonia rubra]